MIRTPACCSGSASLSGVWPPNCTRHDTVAARLALAAMMASTSSSVSGSKYSRSAVS